MRGHLRSQGSDTVTHRARGRFTLKSPQNMILPSTAALTGKGHTYARRIERDKPGKKSRRRKAERADRVARLFVAICEQGMDPDNFAAAWAKAIEIDGHGKTMRSPALDAVAFGEQAE